MEINRFNQFNNLFKVLASFQDSSHVISEHESLYFSILQSNRSLIYCSCDCFDKSSFKNSHSIITTKRIGLVMPIDDIYVICSSCDKKITSGDELFVAVSNNKSDLEKVYENIYKKKDEGNVAYPTFEVIFSKYFLMFLIIRLIIRYQSKGVFFCLDNHDKLAVNWLMLNFSNLTHFVESGEKFYRVQKKYIGFDPSKKESFRVSDIEYAGGAKRFTRIGNWHLYLARDLETAKKEARISDGDDYYSAEFIVRKNFSFLDVRHISSDVHVMMNSSIYDGYSRIHGGSLQSQIIFSAASSLLTQYFHPNAIQKVDDKKSFKIEYNIMQLLSDVAIEFGMESIVYYSTHSHPNPCICFFNSSEIDEYFNQGDYVFYPACKK